MASAQEILRDMLKVHVGPPLRAAGYAGSGQDYHKRIDGNWAAINVQRDRYSTADELRFTVNIGTASAAVRVEDGYPDDEWAREVDCHWRTRLGTLLPGASDRWWTIRSRSRPEEVLTLGGSLADDLTSKAVPKLEEMASDEAILESVLPGSEPIPGMFPAQMDVVGPILRRIGPPDRLTRHLEVCDSNGARSASLYEMFDEYPPARLGPVRIRKRLENLSRVGFEPWQQAIIDLGYAKPTEEIKAALRPFLGNANTYIRFAAAQALGRLGDIEVAPNLRSMVRDEPARATAVHAAFALAKLDKRLDETGRAESRAAMADRRDRAVGHDRAALSELLRRLGEPSRGRRRRPPSSRGEADGPRKVQIGSEQVGSADRRQALTVSQRAIGLLSLTPGNLAKPRSVVINVAPCSIASAAK